MCGDVTFSDPQIISNAYLCGPKSRLKIVVGCTVHMSPCMSPSHDVTKAMRINCLGIDVHIHKRVWVGDKSVIHKATDRN
jgi:carbonic anhydrase/acetyltransferase-like protein (isoleucine patch superfamily)